MSQSHSSQDVPAPAQDQAVYVDKVAGSKSSSFFTNQACFCQNQAAFLQIKPVFVKIKQLFLQNWGPFISLSE
jgi:hypothetical protein